MDQDFTRPVDSSAQTDNPATESPVSYGPSAPVGNPANVWSVFFILFGAYIFIPSFQKVYLTQVSGSWPVVEGKVISSEVEKRWPDRNETFDQGYLPRIWYAYKIDGTEYMGYTLRFDEGYTKDIKRVEDTVKRYPVGQVIQVLHNPKDPAITTVERSGVPAFDCFKLGLGLVFLFFGVVSFWSVMMQRTRDR